MRASAAAELEILSELADGPARDVDLLFLHGISAGAWIWKETCLADFAAQGFHSHALSFSGHGASSSHRPLSQLTLADYTQDIVSALQQIDRPCVVVAHSLGGAALQALLGQHPQIVGAVLLCSVPPYGLGRASMEMAWKHPSIFREMALYSLLGMSATDINALRDGFFPSGVDDVTFHSVVGRLQDESFWAMWQATTGMPTFASWRSLGKRLRVIGAEEDCFVPVWDTMMTAALYGVSAQIIPGAGHMLMYEPAGQMAIADIQAWLERMWPRK